MKTYLGAGLLLATSALNIREPEPSIIQKESVTLYLKGSKACVKLSTTRIQGKLNDHYQCGHIAMTLVREKYFVEINHVVQHRKPQNTYSPLRQYR